MKRLFPLFIMLSLSLVINGQDETDALRYARTNPGGTARSMAMGGAFGSLGGDFSAVIQNPAGLGVYRKAELSFSPEIYYVATSASYAGTSSKDWGTNLNIAQFSYVSPLKFKGNSKVGVNFGIGYNQLNNFFGDVTIEGNGITSSRVDPFIESANTGAWGNPVPSYYLNSYSEKLFYDGYIIDRDENGNYYLNTDIRDAGGNVNLIQKDIIDRSGKMNEWTFSMGFNVQHKLYFGASLNITPFDYAETSLFSETEGDGSVQYYEFEQIEVTEGVGYGAKAGIIFKPLSLLRLGFAYHTPTYYTITQNTYSTLFSYVNEVVIPIDPEGYEKFDSISTYSLQTPAKMVGSVGIMLGKFMILSTDLELVDYSGIKYYSRNIDTDFAAENESIDADFNYTVNLRSGAELRLKNLYLRGGFAYLGSPYNGGTSNLVSYQLNYSGGFGFRMKRMYIDFALSSQEGRSTSVLYDSPYQTGVSAATLDTRTVRAITTVGLRF
ncbi:MAG: hypothetical protein JW801_12725 [Bacteroidales bacterium]|nr:hypothetical protein [Bacteroidales bacterium]